MAIVLVSRKGAKTQSSAKKEFSILISLRVSLRLSAFA
jgi:hypothetical protein